MSHPDLRAPVSRNNHVVIADAPMPWLDALAESLTAEQLTVQRAPAADAAFAAFVSGAAVAVMAPGPAQAVADVWLAVVERSARALPMTVVVLPDVRRDEAPMWLAAGFDEVCIEGDEPVVTARRLNARLVSRAARQRLAIEDPLTGLPSHDAFFDRLDPAIRLSSRASMPMAVAVLDLDGFVALEQTAGRPLARQVVVDVARHLQSALRRSDTVARLGDDRFGLILNHITAFEAKRLVYKLWRSLTLGPDTLERLGDGAARLTFTAGIAVFPGDSSDPHELYTRAEIALDVARATGQRRVLLYAETSGDSGEDRHGTDLRYHRVQGGRREDPE